MDSKLFRLPTGPNLYAHQEGYNVHKLSKKSTAPTQDSRFPGYAAPLQDGRLVTDYRSHCEKNIPVESQEQTRIWLQRNATNIMLLSQQRAAEQTGAIYGMDQTVVPPPAVIVDCAPGSCVRTKTRFLDGIGTERRGADAPDLFGTFSPSAFLPPPTPKVSGTTVYEGGRNTPRNFA